MNGVQAVSYARIRYTAGGDFQRASRQRQVLSLIAEKAQTMSLSTINKIIDSVFPQVSTNFTLTEMVAYAKDFKKYSIGESKGFPEDNTTDMLNVVGSVVIPTSLSASVEDIHKFLFGDDGYQASSNILAIEGGIATKAADRSTGGVETETEEYYYEETDDSGDYGGGYSETDEYYDYDTDDTGGYEDSGTGEDYGEDYY